MSPLRIARRDQLLTLAELGTIVGTTKQHLSGIERGTRPAGWRLRKRISRALGVSEAVLFREPAA